MKVYMFGRVGERSPVACVGITVKFEGCNVVVWRISSAASDDSFHHLHGNDNSEVCKHILFQQTIPSLRSSFDFYAELCAMSLSFI